MAGAAPPSLVLGVSLTTPEKMLMRSKKTVTRRAVLGGLFLTLIQ